MSRLWTIICQMKTEWGYIYRPNTKRKLSLLLDPAIKKLADDSQIPFLPKLVEPVIMQEEIDVLEV